MSRIFKMSIGANLKLLKKIEKDLANAWKTKKGETDDDLLAMGRTIYANELQDKIKRWKSDIGYEEGVKEIDKLLR